MAEIFQTSGPNNVGRTMCVLFISFGVLWIFAIGFDGLDLLYTLLGAPFIVFGLLWLLRDTPGIRLILGVIGAIVTFYSAITWSNTMGIQSGGLMTAYSIALLAISLGIIVSVTCAWPDEPQYGM